MEAAAVAIQQSMLQTKIGLAMIKQQAQAQQSLVDMIAQTAEALNASGRGQVVNMFA